MPDQFLSIIQGDARSIELPDDSVHCCITSPPYWGLRDYGVEGQLGLEATPEEYVANMVAVFEEVRRVLRPDGTLWLNLGDSYAGSGRGGHIGKSTLDGSRRNQLECRKARGSQKPAGFHENARTAGAIGRAWVPPPAGLKQKDLVGIPWMVAFALRSAGWYLRQDIIWQKPNPMPESVRDRCTKSHEYLFLLSKSERYYFDAEAISERSVGEASTRPSKKRGDFNGKNDKPGEGMLGSFRAVTATRNKRSVWTITTQPFPEAHFATFPVALVSPCILAGTSEKGVCPECGAQWVRVLEKQQTGRGDTSSNLSDGINARSTQLSLATKRQAYRAMGMEGPPASATLGWRPGCECNQAPVPAVVLDCFSGAATTGLACLRLGRSYIGIDKKPEYVQMGRERLAIEKHKRATPLFQQSVSV